MSANFCASLKDDGYLVVTLPDFEEEVPSCCSPRQTTEGKLTGAGLPICPMDILYGWRPAMANGCSPIWRTRMGLHGQDLLQKALMQAEVWLCCHQKRQRDFASVCRCQQNQKSRLRKLAGGFSKVLERGVGRAQHPLPAEKEEPAVNIAEPSNVSKKIILEKPLSLYPSRKSVGRFYLEDDVRLYLAAQGTNPTRKIKSGMCLNRSQRFCAAII